MSNATATDDRVVAVLLADGWHQIVPGSFSIGPLGLGGHTDLDRSGFRFEESRTGSPYQPAALAGPLDSIIAVRQTSKAGKAASGTVTPLASRNGHDGVRQPALGRW